VSFRVQRRLPDCRPESVPEGVLSTLAAFPVLVEIVVAQRPHDPSAEPMRLTRKATDEVEDLPQTSSVAQVSGEHERSIAPGPVVGRIDEAERAKNILRAVLEKLRDVITMRGESRLDRHLLHDDILHLKEVELIGCNAENETASSEVLTGADIYLSGEKVAQVVVDRRVVLDIHFHRESVPAPMLHQSWDVVQYVRDQDEWPILIDPHGRTKLGERTLVVHPHDGKCSVVDRVGCHCVENGMK
jgi:hypothetical protein